MQKFENILTAELAKIGRTIGTASLNELYTAVSKAGVGHVARKWCHPKKGKRAAYFSAEFLIGRMVYSNLLNAGLYDRFERLMQDNGVSPDVFESIGDAALGNGGLGRLAACYLDSAASCSIALDGYGIRYRYGLFRQSFENGFQRESADDWLRFSDPWSTRREIEAVNVIFKGETVRAVPYDMPIIGYGGKTVNNLRLWQAESDEPFDFELFDKQKYAQASATRVKAERISDVLYPNDSTDEGKKLRLKQEYFLVSASLQDMLKKCSGEPFDKHHTIQLNDTHPVLAIPELIRLLIKQGDKFDDAFETARRTFSYTNHTVMPEALEKWSEKLLNAVVPQLLPILRRIQKKLERELVEKGVADLSKFNILENKTVHMARLAIFVSGRVNGVAAIHTDILKNDLFVHWNSVYPDRFVNITNGITQRRWLALANRELTELIAQKIGDDFITDAEKLSQLTGLANDADFIDRLNNVKKVKKQQLAEFILRKEGKLINADAIFDVQIKRLHEYKRQLLNAFSILDTYFRIKDGQLQNFNPTVYIFGAKAAPGYYMAKAIIKFINEIAKLIESDESVNKLMQVVFVTDYNVSYAEKIIPAADISEQISLAGTEASGTGNMKLMMNGALTLGTYDGANVEIVEKAGRENNYIFGLTVEQVKATDNYSPSELIESDERLKRVVNTLVDGTLSDNGTGMFYKLYESVVNEDRYMVCKDFKSYCDIRDKANSDFYDMYQTGVKRLMNIANSGYFSSDRSVREYNKLIWRLK